MLRTFFLLAGLVLLAWVVVALGPREIVALLRQIGWGVVPIAAIYAAYQACRALALRHAIVRDAAIPFVDLLRIRVSGEAVQVLTFTGPFLAEPSKAWLLGRRGLALTEGFAATTAEYLIYTLISAVILSVGLTGLLVYYDLSGVLATAARVVVTIAIVFLGVAAVAIAGRIYLIGAVLAALGRLPVVGRRLRLDAAAVRRVEDLLLEVLREQPARLARVALFEIAAQILLVAELAWILALAGLPWSVWDAFLIESSTKFTTMAFFFIPGQVGASEGVLALVFATVGLPAAGGVAAAIVRRVRSLLVAAIGLAALAAMSRARPSVPGL